MRHRGEKGVHDDQFRCPAVPEVLMYYVSNTRKKSLHHRQFLDLHQAQYPLLDRDCCCRLLSCVLVSHYHQIHWHRLYYGSASCSRQWLVLLLRPPEAALQKNYPGGEGHERYPVPYLPSLSHNLTPRKQRSSSLASATCCFA